MLTLQSIRLRSVYSLLDRLAKVPVREVFSVARIPKLAKITVEAGKVHVRWAPINGRSFEDEWIPADRLQGEHYFSFLQFSPSQKEICWTFENVSPLRLQPHLYASLGHLRGLQPIYSFKYTLSTHLRISRDEWKACMY